VKIASSLRSSQMTLEGLLGGPNGSLSLRAAQARFRRYGAAEPTFADKVGAPEPDEL
jgi:hypothetical protein